MMKDDAMFCDVYLSLLGVSCIVFDVLLKYLAFERNDAKNGTVRVNNYL
jgi:hypothetical protein